ncbi:MAG: TIGR00282 family metallophosphoesterase [Acidobacteriota bacterium]|jgi:metallophosphoesterase (TIGR00282 family)|nr:TIGR00282 family metallophosphoesterase [Acidobacteriota bacterium]
MRIFIIGDVFGRPGRRLVEEKLAGIVREREIDFCVANVENAAAGFGITPKIADELLATGIDVFTSGNHIWDKKPIIPYLAGQPRLLRPHNYPKGVPGTGVYIGETKKGERVGVLNLQGRTFMASIDCPFTVGMEAVEALRKETPVIVVDFHAEATSEKQGLGWHLDGRASAVVGTHTHVLTADERLLPRGTAYITDIGMTGAHDSIIGSDTRIALDRMILQIPNRLEPAAANLRFNGVIVDIDAGTGRARGIERIDIPFDL